MQNGSCLVQKVELDIGIQHTRILRRHDLRFVKSHDLPQGLKNGFVRGKYQCIMAEALVLRILLGQQEFVENTGAHENGFSQPHCKSVDIVGVILTVFFHLLEKGIR